jgi:hypothetical protein
VQLDEVWTFVGQRKKRKRWLFYAYAQETDEVLAWRNLPRPWLLHKSGISVLVSAGIVTFGSSMGKGCLGRAAFLREY